MVRPTPIMSDATIRQVTPILLTILSHSLWHLVDLLVAVDLVVERPRVHYFVQVLFQQELSLFRHDIYQKLMHGNMIVVLQGLISGVASSVQLNLSIKAHPTHVYLHLLS